MNTSVQKPKAQSNQVSIYLVYLAFLFLPWLFYPPGLIDVIVTLAAAAIYLPLHLRVHQKENPYRLYFIAAIAALGVAIAPFQNGYSVFHIYAAAAAGLISPLRTSRIAFGVCIIVYLGSGLLFDRYSLEIVVGLVISVIVWVSTLSEAQVQANHEQAERERELDSQHASLVERERIARDLHDLLGHTLTLISLKADLANRLLETDSDGAKTAIADIQSSSRQALADVRATLSGITATNAGQEIANAKAALKAAEIELTINGSIPEATPELSEEAVSAIGLTIREAITNIVRHSSATAVTVSFKNDGKEFGVTISDNGTSSDLTEGNGLVGLRRRLESLGGLLSVGKNADVSGIKIQATLPA